MSLVPSVQVDSNALPRRANSNLKHLPGPKGHWYFGNLRALLPDPVFRETLRLYSPVQLLPRRNVRGFEFRGKHIPGNSQILLSPQLCHRDRILFEQPHAFRPERFLATGPDNRADPFSFVPFGKGSHMCIGMRFATLAVKAFFALLLRTYYLQLSVDRLPVIQYLPMLRPRHRLPLCFVPHKG